MGSPRLLGGAHIRHETLYAQTRVNRSLRYAVPHPYVRRYAPDSGARVKQQTSKSGNRSLQAQTPLRHAQRQLRDKPDPNEGKPPNPGGQRTTNAGPTVHSQATEPNRLARHANLNYQRAHLWWHPPRGQSRLTGAAAARALSGASSF